jgi:hypothetical protein
MGNDACRVSKTQSYFGGFCTAAGGEGLAGERLVNDPKGLIKTFRVIFIKIFLIMSRAAPTLTKTGNDKIIGNQADSLSLQKLRILLIINPGDL